MRAWTRDCSAPRMPAMCRISGAATSLKMVSAEEGYPGRPMNGLPFASPMIVGLPGLILMPWTSTLPMPATVPNIMSDAPAEVLPDVRTTSTFFEASSSAFLNVLRLVPDDAEIDRHAAVLVHAGAHRVGVDVVDLAGLQLRARRGDLVAGRDDADLRLPVDIDYAEADGGQHADLP